jgi:hypothetical protein
MNLPFSSAESVEWVIIHSSLRTETRPKRLSGRQGRRVSEETRLILTSQHPNWQKGSVQKVPWPQGLPTTQRNGQEVELKTR